MIKKVFASMIYILVLNVYNSNMIFLNEDRVDLILKRKLKERGIEKI